MADFDRLSKLIDYDPAAGTFTTRVRRGPLPAGVIIPIEGQLVEAGGACLTFGRVAWILGTGRAPLGRIQRKDTSQGYQLANLYDTGASQPKKKSRVRVTQQRLRELLRYCPATGLFSWRVSPSSTARVGEVAGCLGPGGYILIRLDGVLYLAHRLAMLYVYGEWPPHLVDHKNGVRHDNRLDNLRHATQSENGQNKRRAIASNRTTGLLGVYRYGGKFGAKVSLMDRQYHAGFHDTPEAAHQAYIRRKAELHPYSTMHLAQEMQCSS